MKKLKVLLLVDLTGPESKPNYDELLQSKDWETEREVYQALHKLGHQVRIVGLFSDIKPLLDEVGADRPDIVFNLAEHFNNHPSYERDVAALLEMLGLPFTGSGPLGLSLSRNKGLMKKLMAFHHIKTPKFTVVPLNKTPHVPAELKFPFFIKPANEDASYGISQASFVEGKESYEERVRFVHQTMNQSALVEEYIEGRELYVSAIGFDRFRVLPVRELVFQQVGQDDPKIATYKAKWDLAYRDKWGIRNQFANPLAAGVEDRLARVTKRVLKILNITGYGRLDIRLTAENEIMIIEANANPAITSHEDLPQSAEKAGISYENLVSRILQYGLAAAGR